MKNVPSSVLPSNWEGPKSRRLLKQELGVFGEVAKMGVGHFASQEAFGGVIISQAHVKDGLRAVLGRVSLFLPHGSAGLQGPCIANKEHLSGIHVYK